MNAPRSDNILSTPARPIRQILRCLNRFLAIKYDILSNLMEINSYCFCSRWSLGTKWAIALFRNPNIEKKSCLVQCQERHGSHNLHVLMDLLNCINHQTFKIWMKTKKLPSWIACLSSNFCLNISTIIFFLPWLCNKQLFTRLTETL